MLVLLYGVGRFAGGLQGRDSLLLGCTLALGGEFAFVVFGDALRAGLITPELRGHLVAIVGVSMALTPPLYIAMTRWLAQKKAPQPEKFDKIEFDDEPKVLIAGMGRFGQVEEIAALVRMRHLANDAHHCPHGRPTALLFTRQELDRQFRRI